MTDEPTEMELQAYVDDQLDAGRRFAVEAHLSDRPDLAARLMRDLSMKSALRLLTIRDEPLPAGIAAAADGLSRRGRALRWGRAAPLGGVALAAGLGAYLFLSDSPPDYVDMALASHRVALIRAQMASQVETPALDYQEILANTRIIVPTLPADWRVTDVQLFPADNAPALLIWVKTADGRNFSIFAQRARSKAPETPDAVREGAQSVAYWRRGEMSYALTGDGEPDVLDDTAEHLNQSWS